MSKNYKEDYEQHASTVFWMMKEKDFAMGVALKLIAKKHNLIKAKLEKEVRKILPEGFLEKRKRAAQNSFVPKMMFDECKPKKKVK